MTLGVVVPCHRQESYLPRTVAALERGLAGHAWRGVIVLGGRDDAAAPPPAFGASWRVLAPPAGVAGTPGAARMLGFAAVEGEWTLFVDADTEVDAGWLTRALAATAGDVHIAGYGGRLEERVFAAGREWAGVPDLNRVGDAERDIELLTTPALYRREALLAVGGYDPRLGAEEDFELGLRLRGAGWRLRLLAGPAARHWNPPRPSLTELARRWRFGLTFGPGEALRLYLGRPGFGALLARQRLPIATLALWCAGVAALGASAAGAGVWPLLGWSVAVALLMAGVTARKRSVRLALLGLLTWSANGIGVLVGFARPPRRGGPRWGRA